ncbi:hypothetical protein DYB28_013510, partial [Aphanomyces astaci]
MQRKVRMCTENASVSRWLSAHFEWTQANVVIQSHILLRGYLYYPLALLASTTSTLSSTRVELPSAINADHLRGWWSSDVEADLIRTTPPSSRFAILPKLFWLSKVSSVPSNDDDHTQHIVGSPGVPSLPLLTVDFALDPLTTTTTQFIAQLSLALGDDGISYSVVKAEVARVLMHRKGRYLVQCLVVLVELEDGNLFRIGQLMLDARGLVHVDDDDDGGIDHVMATIIPDKTKWWSVRFLLKAKHVLGGASASSPRHDQ